MEWLNGDKLSSNKYDWIGGGCDGLNEFKGSIMDYLNMIDSEITLILENELGEVKGKFIGTKISSFLDFYKKDSRLKEFREKYIDFPNNLKLLNKIRIFAAHGHDSINAKTGKEIALIKEDDGTYEGLLFDEKLVKEVEDLFNKCEVIISNMQIELGYYDEELGI